MRDTYDPFGWRQAQLADPHLSDRYRRELLDGLVIHEAEEIARGRHHLTILHGAPADPAADTLLDGVYDVVAQLCSDLPWVRIAGTADYVTVTVERVGFAVVAALRQFAERRNPGWWEILETPRPLPTSAGPDRQP